VELVEKLIRSRSYTVRPSSFDGIIADQKTLWNAAKKEGFIVDELTTSTWVITAKEEGPVLPSGLDHCGTVLRDYLMEHNGQIFNESSSLNDFH
jgi:hypothetical protein